MTDILINVTDGDEYTIKITDSSAKIQLYNSPLDGSSTLKQITNLVTEMEMALENKVNIEDTYTKDEFSFIVTEILSAGVNRDLLLTIYYIFESIINSNPDQTDIYMRRFKEVYIDKEAAPGETTHNIILGLTNCTIATTRPYEGIPTGQNWFGRVEPEQGYVVANVIIMSNGVDITNGAYDSALRTITINNIRNDVYILAIATREEEE